MRKLIQLAIVALGIRALMRWRKKRKEQEATAAAAAAPASDPAAELRRKLAESREGEAPPEADAPPVAVADRRADVHEQGRATLDEMTSSSED